MHKKPFIAVLALGLLLFATAGFAGPVPPPGETAPVLHVQGAVSAPASRSALTPIPAPGGPMVQIQAGASRTVPGTFCDGQWQYPPQPSIYYIGGWFEGYEPSVTLTYQDPNTLGSCAPGSNYTFDVTAVDVIIGTGSVINGAKFRPVLFDVDLTNPACPVPGSIIHLGPTYSVNFPTVGGAAYTVSFPFAIEACVTGPYFAGIIASDPAFDYQDLGIGIDYPNGAAVTCADYSNDFYGTMFESGWYNFWTGAYGTNLYIWSEGYTPDDQLTHCTPGTCTREVYWSNNPDNIDAGFGFPTATRDKLAIRIEANGLDTLTAIHFMMNGGATPADSADLQIEIYPISTSSACGDVPAFAAVPVYTQVIPAGTWIMGDYTDVTLTTPFIWGTLNGGPTQKYALAMGVVPGTGTTPGFLGGDPVTGCLPFNSHRSMARYPALTSWLYIGEVSAQQRELVYEATICREQLPAIEGACASPGPDSWRHYAHDNQQTSASSINVGDPNGPVMIWNKPLPAVSNFTNPTVAGDVVYISSDQTVTAYNLISGAPAGTFAGGPEMGSSNRGNTTVAYIAALGRDVVFATGGTLNSITALETNLELSSKIWSLNAGTFPPFGLGGSSLGAGLVRFNTATVVNIAGTDVIFVVTEPSSGTGRLWALDAATGALYAPGGGNWATNPIILDQAAKHGPATDGTNLYVGTALTTNTGPGSLYSFNAATGAMNWQYVEPNGEGWPSGVSVEGDYLYGATRGLSNAAHRYKINKAGAGPVVTWSSAQPAGTYGTPTIGRAFVYFPLDNPASGILQVNKDLGLASRNFAASDDICGITVGNVPQIATLSCDGYLFAGDRNSRWWLLNAVTGQYEWFRDFNDPGFAIVNGTALAHGSDGNDYAVIGVRQVGAGGYVASYQLNGGTRPRMIQCVEDVVIPVPFGTGGGNAYSEADAILNVGSADLHITAWTVTDPPPDALASIRRDQRKVVAAQSRVTARYMNEDGFFAPEADKALTIAGMKSPSVDGEFTVDQMSVINKYNEALSQTGRNRRMAAGASTIRTDFVTFGGAAVPVTLTPGSAVSVDWIWTGAGLLRGQDANVLTFTHDDPDYQPDQSPTADINILYVGGCAQANTFITWNTGGAGNYAKVFNHGAFGDQDVSALHIGDDASAVLDAALFDGGVLITGDSSAAIAGAELAIDYYDIEGYVANPNPFGNCDFIKDSNLVLGYKSDPPGACPGTPVAIEGMYVKTYYADSNLNAASNADPLAAIGVTVDQTEVGANDPLYGDFKLTRLVITNRDAVDKVIRAGTYFDWDINGNSSANVAIASSGFNGYAIWAQGVANEHFAYGMLDAHQPSLYAGVDPTAFPPALIMSNLNDTTYTGQGGGYWRGNTYPNDWAYGWWLTNGKYLGPIGCMGGCGAAGVSDDRGGFLANEINLLANSSAEVVQTMFAFSVVGNSLNDAFVEANGLDVAKRSARWAGFARGDVNDDGFVSLADVCYLQGYVVAGGQLYPDTYCGDVNNSGGVDGADVAQLLSFVSGNVGSQPVGAWRFPW